MEQYCFFINKGIIKIYKLFDNDNIYSILNNNINNLLNNNNNSIETLTKLKILFEILYEIRYNSDELLSKKN